MFKFFVFYLLLSIFPIKVFADNLIKGVGIHPLTHELTDENFFDILLKYNITSFRTDYPWSRVEKKKGVYQDADSRIDSIVNAAVNKKIEPMLILDYGNILYDPKTDDNPRSKPNSIASRDAFIKYSGWVASHFRLKVNMYEVWNEWIQTDGRKGLNHFSVFNDDSAKIFSDLVLRSCIEIKNNNPKAKVIAGGIDPFDKKSEIWMMKVVSTGIMKCLDGISLHPYYYPNDSNISSDPVMDKLVEVHKMLVKANEGNEVDLYVTEIGVPLVKYAKYSDSDISEYIHNLYSKASGYSFIKGIWWYDLIDDGKNKNEIQQNFGLLNNDGAPKKIMDEFLNLKN
ncbi:hypothetical protein B1209_08295 [Raoultella planticola]|uniref:hypothetical protein n=1 Tax=Raoultella planticola TaxID=575 RepID=UPI000536AD10|nr:hypothetical protein [Raoultella planticola]AUU07080.1 hypothetical protein MC50_026190 [Raoultella planticola]AUV52825.1 hypothetical protein B1209_08295 [Raoultella planticola]PNK80074.1 hypothetical protein CEP62_019285 [Raoultella planticola]HDG9791030.1 hypothetical protein [Raoultella planticola]HDH7773060.1 hypothetical protein [Raoultella planticola]